MANVISKRAFATRGMAINGDDNFLQDLNLFGAKIRENFYLQCFHPYFVAPTNSKKMSAPIPDQSTLVYEMI